MTEILIKCYRVPPLFKEAVLDWTYGIAIVLQFHMTQPTREHNLSFLMTDSFEDCHYNAVDGLLYIVSRLTADWFHAASGFGCVHVLKYTLHKCTVLTNLQRASQSHLAHLQRCEIITSI